MNPEAIFQDPCASDWLKKALRDCLNRDPVDAANDAEVLAKILEEKLKNLRAGL